jgi:hypothetical protein
MSLEAVKLIGSKCEIVVKKVEPRLALIISIPTAARLCEVIAGVFLSHVHGVPAIIAELPTFDGFDVPAVNLKHTLKRRAMCIAHAETTGKVDLGLAGYFQEAWDGGDRLTLRSGFRPSVYAASFGKAVGWESQLKEVCFAGAAFEGSGVFFRRMLETAVSIKRVILVGYGQNKASTQLKFDFTGVHATSVESWQFISSDASLVKAWLNALARVEGEAPRVREVALARRGFGAEATVSIMTGLSRLREIRSLRFIAVNFEAFAAEEFSRALAGFECLEALLFKNVNVDGSALLAAVCVPGAVVQRLGIRRARFAGPISGLALPLGLAVLDVSKSRFVGRTFRDFLVGITSTAVAAGQEFMLVARALQLEEDTFEELRALGQMPVGFPNICEFDLSRCPFYVAPGTHRRSTTGLERLFEFIRAQSSATELVFDRVTVDDQEGLRRCLIDTILNDQVRARITGLEIDVLFDLENMRGIVMSMAGTKQLRRLVLRNSGIGDDGLGLTIDLLGTLSGSTRRDGRFGSVSKLCGESISAW